jgi:hypothetical protein
MRRPTIWKIYLRMPGAEEEYLPICHGRGFVAVGWGRGKDLSRLTRVELQRHFLARKDVDLPRARNWTASIWAFCHSIQRGDIVVCPGSTNGKSLIGEVQSSVWFEASPEDECPFEHRRRVVWQRYVDGTFPGGVQTVSRLRVSGKQLAGSRPITRSVARGRRGVPHAPDAGWGRLAEERAIEWLCQRGRRPKDVAHLCKGWDVEDGDTKYEVKGRHTRGATVRLTENEFNAARRHGPRYVLLVFTARDSDVLRIAVPRQIPDPTRTEEWGVRRIREYLAEGL